MPAKSTEFDIVDNKKNVEKKKKGFFPPVIELF